jgi:hypothetical protein
MVFVFLVESQRVNLLLYGLQKLRKISKSKSVTMEENLQRQGVEGIKNIKKITRM